MTNIQERQTQLRRLCESLKKTDADLIDIIQFGSSVYAPELARDIDLLVTTRAKDKEEVYWDTFADLDLGVSLWRATTSRSHQRAHRRGARQPPLFAVEDCRRGGVGVTRDRALRVSARQLISLLRESW